MYAMELGPEQSITVEDGPELFVRLDVVVLQSDYRTLQQLPRRYDHKALEAYWSARSGELNSRWATFLQATIPYTAKGAGHYKASSSVVYIFV